MCESSVLPIGRSASGERLIFTVTQDALFICRERLYFCVGKSGQYFRFFVERGFDTRQYRSAGCQDQGCGLAGFNIGEVIYQLFKL